MRITVFIILLLLPCKMVSQSYASSLGLRLGNDNISRTVGLSFQQRVLRKTTLEAIAQTDFNNNSTGHLLLERHHSFLTKRFNLYVGAGMSFGNEESQLKNSDTNEITLTYNNRTFGADLIFGVEATLLSYNVSIDYKPNFNLTDRNPWYLGQVGISARSVLVSGAKQNKRKRQRTRAKRKRQRAKAKKDEEPWLKEWYEGLRKK